MTTIYTMQPVHHGARIAHARPGPDGSFWYHFDGEIFWTSAKSVERLGVAWLSVYRSSLERADLEQKRAAAVRLMRDWHRICRETEQSMPRPRTEAPSGRAARIVRACWDAAQLRLDSVPIGATAALP